MSAEQDFITSFESLELPIAEFDHAAHVRLAWAYLQDHPLPEAMNRYREGLKRFTAHHGKSELYHETITFAFILLIHERIHAAGRSAGDWPSFAEWNPDLLRDGKSALFRLYREETLSSALARRVYLPPDRNLASRAE